jgi:nicotinamide mononucleotide transporter
MSYIEFFGTVFSIWCVYLTARAKVLSWPVGILGTILYLFLFYQIHLYSDMIEQMYFLITGFVGWYAWLHPRTSENADTNKQLKISFNTVKQNIFYAIGILAGTFVLTFVVTHLDNWLPQYFPVEASFAFIDALTTVMSFVAQYLLIRKKVENWFLWIIVDIVGIWLYYQKGVKFISMEYVLFLGIASYGFWGWIKELKARKEINVHDHEQETAKI